ncbi:MAG: PEP-CTERM sorting domain-containing protein [Planctomycetes bacterium]|nr:PEP-CTERM sorting domain-containing protein [Planctomycetota bacterium]
MVRNNSISVGWQKLILVLVLAVFFCSLLEPAWSQTPGPVLLLQQIPANGGTITPGAGVHYLQQNTSVTLTAIPRPGYQFVCWLGDVGNPTLNRTNTYLDTPKIVVAIFERAEYELEGGAGVAQSIPGSTFGGLRGSAADYSRQGYSGGGGRRAEQRVFTLPPIPPEQEPLPPPEVPVPTPEPTTIVLLGLGGLFTFSRRRSRKLICKKTP